MHLFGTKYSNFEYNSMNTWNGFLTQNYSIISLYLECVAILVNIYSSLNIKTSHVNKVSDDVADISQIC